GFCALAGSLVLTIVPGWGAAWQGIVSAAVAGFVAIGLAHRGMRQPVDVARDPNRGLRLRGWRRRRRRTPEPSERERFEELEDRKLRARERLKKSVWFRIPIFRRYDMNIRDE
ncbi:MAG: hypothetical protein KDC38_15220, partial [Planctomycetes bacterium]|nr:hypothetical protein [Planctomycetota bacterium]